MVESTCSLIFILKMNTNYYIKVMFLYLKQTEISIMFLRPINCKFYTLIKIENSYLFKFINIQILNQTQKKKMQHNVFCN